ncbi:MAG: hypothetical protein M1832_004518 [Thelocarpon impressellum]|nr:MAG: hypothetical protein M1832_004518 [Thelocarpon impressellum]
MSSSAAHSGARPYSWQEKLEEHCRAAQMHPPVFSIVSDRRGGRTAWSSTVTIEGQIIAARYWYDGQYVHNAKEDAAEVALQTLRVIPNPSSPGGGSSSRGGRQYAMTSA